MTYSLTLQFLGSGDTFGSGGRFQTCFLVEAGPTRFLIDCGASSLTAMKRLGVEPGSIDAIVISHLHGDHFGGLPFFVLEGQLASRRQRPLVVAGPPGIEARTQVALEVFFPGSSRVRRAFEVVFVELAEAETTELLAGRLAVTPYAVVHPSGAPAYALRLRCLDRTIAYSGDTAWTEALVDAAQDADLFICEAYFFEKRVPYHLDYRTLAANRDRLGCRRLVLTHMSDDMLGRLTEVEADIEIAEDGKRLVL